MTILEIIVTILTMMLVIAFIVVIAMMTCDEILGLDVLKNVRYKKVRMAKNDQFCKTCKHHETAFKHGDYVDMCRIGGGKNFDAVYGVKMLPSPCQRAWATCNCKYVKEDE